MLITQLQKYNQMHNKRSTLYRYWFGSLSSDENHIGLFYVLNNNTNNTNNTNNNNTNNNTEDL